MAEERIRSFIGIFPPHEITEQIFSVQSQLKDIAPHAKWEQQQKFHITIQFLGDKATYWLNDLYKVLVASIGSQSFIIRLSKIGCFPNRYSPKIFWIGSEREENPELVDCAESVAKMSAGLGHEPEIKPFHPHITVGRAKGKISSLLIHNLETVTFHPLEFQCSELRIMKSVLARSGSNYSTLFNIPLK